MASALHRLRDVVARHRAVAVLVALLVLLLAAVPVGLAVTGAFTAERSTDSSAVDAGGPAPAEARDGLDASAADGSAESSPQAAPDAGPKVAEVEAVPAGPRVIRSAWLAVEVDDLAAAAAQVRTIAAGAGGEVVGESVSYGGRDPEGDVGGGLEGAVPGPYLPWPPDGGSDTAVLTLRVPTDRLAATLDRLAEVGTLVRRTSSAEDVTQSYVDTAARVTTMRAAVARLQALLAEADGLEQVVLLEGELTRRTAELESLEQRLADLDRRTSTADVTVTPTGPAGARDEDPGYWASLWAHLLDSAGVILVGLAVLLPWLALGALVTLVVVLARRRGAARRTRGAAPTGDGA